MNESSRLCPNWLDSYVEYTEDFEPPAVFARWAGILTLAVAAGHRVWLEEANTKIWPNLYVVLVGPSGVGKGQSMREVLPFIEKLGVPISPDKITIPRLTKDLAGAMRFDDELGAYTPYLIWAEELPSFLGLDAYKSGKLADLTTLFDCAKQWESSTKHQGDDKIAQPYICMLAGATASSLFDVLPPASVGQGFTSRLVFVETKEYGQRVPEKPWVEEFHGRLRESLLHDIEIIGKMRGAMRLSDVARVYWNDYYLNRPQPQEEYGDERLQGYAARKPFYAKKLALLLAMAERPQTSEHPMLVEAHHIERAFHLLGDVDKALVDVYSEIAKDSVIGHYSKVVKWLAGKPEMRCTRAEISQRFAYALNAKELTACMASLADMGIIESGQEMVTGIAGSNPRYRITYRLLPGKEGSFQGKKALKWALEDPNVKGYVA